MEGGELDHEREAEDEDVSVDPPLLVGAKNHRVRHFVSVHKRVIM